MRPAKFFGLFIILVSILLIMYGGLSYKMDSFFGISLAQNKWSSFIPMVVGIVGIVMGSSLISKEESRKKKRTTT